MIEGSWTVHKFGGTSLASAERYRGAARIISEQTPKRGAVVVSAMAGVTNALIGLVSLAVRRDASYAAELRDLRRFQIETIGELLPPEDSQAIVARIERDFDDIEDILRALWLLRSDSPNANDLISGYGELWSAQVLAAYLRQQGVAATWLDAREVLTVQPGQLAPIVDWEKSSAGLEAWMTERDEDVVVITGYIASDPQGIATTLGRNGSDYSASIFASLFGAELINIWTDVDGVMSANPRQVPDAVVLDSLSYDEAMELAYFGAKVIHPSTMAPAVTRQIPIYIKNTFNPQVPGTRIHLPVEPQDGRGLAFTVKGFATVDGMALLNVEGTSMIGVPGIAHRLFGALREAGVSVVLISQGSSEHSICFAVPDNQADRARTAVEEAFFAERHHGQIQTIDVQRDCAILAVVGDNMAGIPGVSGSFFGSLGKAGVNIRAIAQGSSERNISVVIDAREATRALRAVHAGFYLSAQTLSIGVIGPGVVGSTLLRQLDEQVERLRKELRIDLRVRAIATSKKMVLDAREVDLGDWRQALNEGEALELERFVEHVQTDGIPHAVIIDCTASESVSRNYEAWLRRGIHVITPNKKANSSEFAYYEQLRRSSRKVQTHYLYETTVGAGLPIVHTLRDLIQTGDRIRKIEGIFSGTLSYLFNAFDGERPFSAIVRDARERGYTEPDPRDDLSGMDVARKLVILAREMGLELELEQVEVESLVPPALRDGSVDQFLESLSEVDSTMNALLERAVEEGEVLRYVGSVNAEGQASVRLRRFPQSHPFARIRLTDNIVEFTTARYDENPLVVQGPGAGPEVTAAGVFADLLRLTTYLGATL